MKKLTYLPAILLIAITCAACSSGNKKEDNKMEQIKGTFKYDLDYLSRKDDQLIVLSGEDGNSKIIVSAKYQAKVFTSTADGLNGTSLGFVNYKFFDADKVDEHMNGFGGENRLWIGPEGGSYSVFFDPASEQIYDNWHTPKPFDIEPWDIVSGNNQSVSFKKEMEVTNYLGNRLKLQIDRSITLIERPETETDLSIGLNPNVKAVGYETENIITNLNDFEWTKETGTVCIWILDMFNSAPRAVTFIPFNEGDKTELGKVVTSDYFGEISVDRLKVTDRMIYLKTDGKCRSKLGLNANRAKSIAGNYDPDAKRLTIVTFDVDKNARYVNQEWNPDKDPLVGDVMNAYNDGPLADGSIMGPFLELESVSPAALLKPRETLSHKHTVYHFIGEEAELSLITQTLFGVSLKEIKETFL